MRTMIAAVTAVTALTASLGASQVPTKPGQVPVQAPVPLPPPKSVHDKCLRPDVQQSKAAIQAALAQPRKPGDPDVTVPQKQIAGCTFYRVTLVSTVTIEDTEVAGVSSTISGQGSITFGLAADDGMAGYDFTSGVQDLTAPVYWTKGSARITRPDCIVTTVELPYTLFGFWLGVTASPFKVGVRIAPDGDELHSIATRCKDPLGRWHDLPNGQEAIFTPAWIKLHGEGKNAVAPTADQQAVIDMTNGLGKAGPKPGAKPMPNMPSPTGAMDLGKLQAMQDYMTKHPNATPAEMMKQMAGVVPNLDQQLAAAEDNFMFAAPGECAAVNAVKTVCTLPSAPVTMKDRTGYGTIKKITEQTVITIEKVPPPPGAP